MTCLDILKKSETFINLPESELQFLLEKGELRNLDKGDFIFKSKEPADHFIFICSGRFRIYINQNDEHREVSTISSGDLTGVLPYSRMTHAQGNGQALEPSEVLLLHRDHFREMITDHHPLTEALVHHMSSRIRELTTLTMQNEKLMSLGKLSAGLAHELNNPAAAMVRSSSTLLKHLKLIPQHFKNVLNIRIEPEAVEKVSDLIFDLVQRPQPKLSIMERSEREDALTDELEACEFADKAPETAEDLVDYGITSDDLKRLSEITGDDAFEPVLKWIIDNLTTERVVTEINQSALRISELISSIKEYSHMDAVKDRQDVDVNEGIRSTIKMLKHKARTNKVEIEEKLSDNLPPLSGFPGELIQVWTNIIDNAFDAMEAEGGSLTVKSEFCSPLLEVQITDTGVGIPEEALNRIFDPFYTTKSIGKGTGLGLDIVNKIVSRHKASLKVKSKPGETTFHISFPIQNA